MTRWLVGIGIAVAAGGLVWWFLATHEKVQDERWVGYSGEAAYNAYFAATRLLAELDIETESRAHLTPTEWLPDVGDTLFLRLSDATGSGQNGDELYDWVHSGGHLVLLAPWTQGVDLDAFLDWFGLATTYLDDVDLDAESVVDDDGFVTVGGYRLDEYYVEQRIEVVSAGPHVATLADEFGVVLVRRPAGDGYVTYTVLTGHFGNGALETADHARLLLDIVAGYVDPGKVWFVYSTDFAPLWRLILEAAPQFVIALALLFAAWLWRVIPRFGPPAAAESLERRSILEHIRAAGRFTWRNRGGERLESAAARALVHAAERRHPGIGRLGAGNQARALARLTGLDEQQVFDALRGGSHGHPREFTQTMQAIQSIRKKL